MAEVICPRAGGCRSLDACRTARACLRDADVRTASPVQAELEHLHRVVSGVDRAASNGLLTLSDAREALRHIAEGLGRLLATAASLQPPAVAAPVEVLAPAPDLLALREKVQAYKAGTPKPRLPLKGKEQIELAAIHKTLNVVLSDIAALLGETQAQEPEVTA